jgi:hypothetical protein
MDSPTLKIVNIDGCFWEERLSSTSNQINSFSFIPCIEVPIQTQEIQQNIEETYDGNEELSCRDSMVVMDSIHDLYPLIDVGIDDAFENNDVDIDEVHPPESPV